MGADHKLVVPDHPISRSSRATARGATSGARACACSTPRWRRPTAARSKIAWFEVFAGEKAFKTSSTTGCPTTRSRPSANYLVGIKGPLTTPVGGGIRSLNVALRQMLDLYVCLRPVRWFKGVPSPGEAPGEGRHGDLPREHRGHLRRHRVRGRQRRGARRSSTSSRRSSRRTSRRSASRRRPRHRHQAGLAARAPSAWCARRSSTRSTTSARASRSSTRATS